MTTTPTAPPAADADGAEAPTGLDQPRTGSGAATGCGSSSASRCSSRWPSRPGPTAGDPQFSAPLDPQNPDPDGAQAVAQVLEDEGVEVVDRPLRRRTPRRRHLRRHHRRGHRHRAAGAEHDPAAARATRPAPTSYSSSRRRTSSRSSRRASARPRLRRDVRRLRRQPVRRPRPDRRQRRPPTTPAPAASPATTGSCWRPAPARRRTSAPARRSATTRCCGATTPPSRCGCSASTTAWSGTSRRSTTPTTTRPSASGRSRPTGSCPSLWLVGFAAIGLILWRGRRLGRLAHRAAAGRRPRGGDDPQPGPDVPQRRRPRATPPRRCAPPPGAASPTTSGSVAARPRPTSSRPSPGTPAASRRRSAPASPRQASVPTTDQGLVQLAQDLTQLDREVRRG